MKQKKRILQKGIGFIAALLVFFSAAMAEDIKFENNPAQQGFNLTEASEAGARVVYSIHEFSLNSVQINGESMQEIGLSGHFLPNDEGAPNLPGNGRMLAVPRNAEVHLNIISFQTEVFQNVDLAPAPRIPWDTDDQPLEYKKDESIYAKNAFYPENPVSLSEITQVRGVDVVMLGITPFQYNPVTQELIVYKDLEVEVKFIGGNGQFGDDRLRSRWWDPILNDMLLNHTSLPEMDYNPATNNRSKDTGCEYLIITPNGADFQAWADSIRVFRTLQGIMTDIVTIDDIGANNANTIENYINDAYDNWDIVPAAVLILADYGSNPSMNITSPIWSNYCVSDNIWADVSGNHMPDIVFARITANNASQLETMVTKFLDYERTPPTDPDFYAHPITALGWQTERWFQICSETVGGFWKNVQGKDPVRINAIYSGYPGSVWSTAPNTSTVVNYFGPNGQSYIPSTPSELGGWTGGNASQVNNAINSGSFFLQHRDHGYEQGWGEPWYSSGNINGLNNTDLTFVMSINCLTGKYNMGGECFTEKFHRHTSGGNNAGALGVVAASEVSYSFVNDTYVWGVYDNMWPNFMPDYGTTPDSRGLLPAFGNSAGKYFLYQSSWPYNTNNKLVTYHLFHHHGDAFLTVYSEVPQNLTVVHEPTLFEGAETFEVTADDGSFIALTANGEIIGTAEGTGSPANISITPQVSGDQVVVTITKQNYFRYASTVDVIPSTTAYAGPDYAICEGLTHTCEGEAQNYNSLEWNTSGTGTFDDNTILQPVYAPSQDDIDEGSVTLTLTVYGDDVTVNDDMVLTISHEAMANAGEDAFTCENTPYAVADAEAENYAALEWTTSGDGTFDDNTLMNPEYTPGTNDVANGMVTLTMTATAMAGCDNVSDEIVLTIEQMPDAFAGEDATLCSSEPYALSDATASNYAGLLWSTSGDGSFDDNTALNAIYTPGENDLTAGSVTLTLTAESNSCTPAVSEVVLSIVAAPDVYAGEDDEICKDETFTVSGAYADNTSSFMWETSGDGTFDDNTSLNPTYTPGTTDIDEGMVTLSLTGTGNDPCGDMSDEIMLAINDCFGIGENEAVQEFRIFPNPGTGLFNLMMSLDEEKVVTITLLNSYGEVISEMEEITVGSNFEKQYRIESGKGVYFMRITGDGIDISRKILVK